MDLIRKSTQSDKAEIRELMHTCFGDRDDVEAYSNLNGRFLLYVSNGRIVAMTGLVYSKKYNAFKVDWTCTHPRFRHRGYMQVLFTKMLENVDYPIYCNCWRLQNKDRVNLQTIMDMFDFKEVIAPRVTQKVPHTCHRNFAGGCINCTGENCTCYEDLYLRKP